jgi:hypothetical protein
MTLREFAINHRLHPLNGSRKLNVPFGCEKQHIAKKAVSLALKNMIQTISNIVNFFLKG